MLLNALEESRRSSNFKSCCVILCKFISENYGIAITKMPIGKSKVFMQSKHYRKVYYSSNHCVVKVQRLVRHKQEIKRQKEAEALKNMSDAERLLIEEQKRMEEEEAAKIEQEKEEHDIESARQERKFKAELEAMNTTYKMQQDELKKHLQGDMDLIKKEYQTREMNELAHIQMQIKQQQQEWESTRLQLKDEMKLNATMKSSHARLESSRRIQSEFHKRKEKLNLEIKALEAKQDSLEQVILKSIDFVKNLKKQIKKVDSIASASGNDNAIDIKKSQIGAVTDDSWKIGSIGQVTEIGGISLYSNLHNSRYGFIGMLRRNDKIALAALTGFCNKNDEGSLAIKIMVVKCQSHKFDDQVGYVRLTATSFYTKSH